MEDRLYSDRLLTEFYDLDNGWDAGLDHCLGLATNARSVLDLGCGTGLLAARLANGKRVVGVDPAGAMLDIARKRAGGNRVTWIDADAREFRSEHRFDLIVMTGHAFQVFLKENDQRAVFETIARHLETGGRFIFDSRNPDTKEWVSWTPERSKRVLLHPRYGEVEAWNDVQHDATTDIVTYQTYYKVVFSNKLFSATSRIIFTSKQRLESLIVEAGLVMERWTGDWDGTTYTDSSTEIIPIGRSVR